jgi:hypothetical protein
MTNVLCPWEIQTEAKRKRAVWKNLKENYCTFLMGVLSLQ